MNTHNNNELANKLSRQLVRCEHGLLVGETSRRILDIILRTIENETNEFGGSATVIHHEPQAPQGFAVARFNNSATMSVDGLTLGILSKNSETQVTDP